MGLSETETPLDQGKREGGEIMGVIKKVKTTARVVRATGRFCVSPLCLHVAGSAKCSYKCCKIGK